MRKYLSTKTGVMFNQFILLKNSKGWFTLRHKHKHKHKHKHNECSHLLHKHKESDIRKRNELQNEAAGVLDERVRF